ncbi:MAG TPA: choice-of-anchor D domain-containing protein, partial [Solirubrobacterales bacterium]|nr:choice-of-anchor D domain-containing protein [Solirubrobacterales bacterium]
TFGPPAHDFGIVRVNRESAAAFMQVPNSGEAPVQVVDFDVQGDTSVFSHGSSSCSLLLAPGQSCSVQVYFSPYDQVDYQAELRASTGGEYFSATLSGRGGRSVIGPASNPVDFGAATVGSKVVKTITLTNSGDLPGAFFIAVIAGGDVGSFRLLSESCTMIELQPAGSCTVRVRFEPQEPGPLSARFAMFGDSDDGTMVFLEGAGLPGPAAAVGAETPGAEDAVASQRKVRKKRFGRNKGIHAPNLRPARRSELRAGAARR